jgi:hypothetical protein
MTPLKRAMPPWYSGNARALHPISDRALKSV